MRRLALAPLLLLLSGCPATQQIAMFTQQDAMQAAAVATAVGNLQQAQCFSSIGTVVAPLSGTTKSGLLTLFAEKFALQSVLEGPQCAQTSLGILLMLLPKPAGL